MKYETAIRKAKSGEFEFIYEPRDGMNEVKYQTPSGKWKTKYIDITGAPRRVPVWGAISSEMQKFML